MGLRDRLRSRARQGLKTLLKRAIDFAGDEEQSSPQPPPKQKAPQSPPPPDKTGDSMPGSGDDGVDLLQQLADSTAQSNELVRRLNDLGMEDQAQSVVASTIGQATDTTQLNSLAFAARHAAEQSRQAVEAAMEALRDSGNSLSDRAKDLMKRAEALSRSANQAAEDAQNLADEVQAKADEIDRLANVMPEHRDITEYDWDRKDVDLPFDDPDKIWENLRDEWNRLAIGVKRDAQGRPAGRSKYAPRMIARGSSLDPGIRVPHWALVNKTAFNTWANETGLGKGLSLTINGIIVGPGMASMLRN